MLVERGLAAPAGGVGVVGWLVLALCVAGQNVGLAELVGGASGWEMGHAHVVCLAGTASAEGFGVCGEDGGALAVG